MQVRPENRCMNGDMRSPRTCQDAVAHTGCGGRCHCLAKRRTNSVSRPLQSPVLLRVLLLWLVADLPLAKAVEPAATLPLLVQLEGQALVPFYLEQKQAGLNGATLGQAVQRQAKRIAGEHVPVTAQQLDSLHHRGQGFDVISSAAFSPADWDLYPDGDSSACWRGYV